LTAGAGAVGVVAGVILAISLASGGGSHPYVLGGPGGPQPGVSARIPRPAPGRAVHKPSFKPRPAAVALAATLPLERQVAQLFLVSVDGTSSSAVAGLGGLRWGGVVLGSSNFQSDGQIGALAADVAAAVASAGGLPPLIAAPQEGGHASAFPDLPPQSEPAIAASGQPSMARAQAVLAAKRLRALGFNMTLAPLADVDTPGGPLNGTLFSSDPAVVGRFSLAAVRGYAAAGMISAVGHFPGTGDASADPNQMSATVGGSLDGLRAHDLVPFAAVAPEAPVILMSNAVYAAFDGVTPAGLLRRAVDLLRNEYGFGGAVMSGDIDAALQAIGGDAGAAAVQALDAGDDLIYVSGPAAEQRAAYDAVLAAAKRSASVRSKVHEALVRVLSLKVRFGLVR
jgi:beta-N-acetylhexosaminidase